MGEAHTVRQGIVRKSLPFSLAVSSGMGLALILAAQTFAQNAPNAAPSSSASTPLGSTFSPEAEAARFESVARQAGQCFNSIGNAAQSVGRTLTANLNTDPATGARQGAAAIGASCEGSTAAPENLSCENFTVGGNFDQARYRAQLASIEASLAVVACKKNNLANARSELACLSRMSQDLQREIAAGRSAFTNGIQSLNNQYAGMTRQEEDFDAQLVDVNGKLTGQGTPGGTGLLQLRQSTQQMIAAMPNEIGQIQEQHNNIELSKRALEEQVKNRQMALASECFSTKTEANYRCEPNGPPKTAMEYAVCRHEQNKQVGYKGRIEDNANTRAQAKASADALKNVLERMMADIPRNSRIPSSQQENQGASDQNVTGISLSQVEAQYGPRLQPFNLPNLDIHRFIMGALNQCYRRSTTVVERERRQVNSTIGVAQNGIQAREREATRQVRVLANRYAQQYAEVTAGFGARSTPADISACANGTPEVQTRCLRNAQSNLEGLLTGGAPGANFSLSVRGTQSNFRVSCAGLNGCIAKLQDTSQKLTLEKKRVGTQKKQFVQSANQSMQRFVERAANAMNGTNRMITERLSGLTTVLAGFGVTLNTKDVDEEQVETDPETGLPKSPRNVVNLVGSAMSPKLVDLTGNNFAAAMSSLTQAGTDLGSKDSALNTAKTNLIALEASCKAQIANAAIENLQQKVEQLAANRCSESAEWCRDYQSPLSSVLGTVNRLSDQAPALSESQVQSILQTGVRNCSTRAPGTSNRAPAATPSSRPTDPPSGSGVGEQPAPEGYNSALCGGVTNSISRAAQRVSNTVGTGTGAATGN